MIAHRIPTTSPVCAFLSACDPTVEIYVTHIDSTNAEHRRDHFLTLLGVNTAFALVLVHRILGGLSRYGIWFLLGKLVPLLSHSPPRLGKALFGNIILDIVIFAILVPVILDFVTLATLRFRHGFPQEEIVFRKPTMTTRVNIAVEAPEKRDVFLKALLDRAVDPETIKQMKFGMPWEAWAYDYRAMAAACEASKQGTIQPNTWQLSVWMRLKNEWSVIQHGQEEDYETRLGMMDTLKDKLQDMGKEHVFQEMMEAMHRTEMAGSNDATDDLDAAITTIFKRNDLNFAKMMGDIALDTPPSFARAQKKDD
ncbi:hypothetical protein V8B97DRAFT_420893 [Scleroderma yunnanense]